MGRPALLAILYLEGVGYSGTARLQLRFEHQGQLRLETVYLVLAADNPLLHPRDVTP